MKTKRKNIFKSLLALTLVLIMVLGVAPLSELAGVDWASLFAPKAEAADGMDTEYVDGYYRYTVENGAATIVRCNNSVSGDITLPTKLGGYPVKGVARIAFLNCENITGITISENITKIESLAFGGLRSLKSITVSSKNPAYMSKDGVLYKGEMRELIQYPIANKRSSFVIPDGVDIVADGAFMYSVNLTNITIPNSVTEIGVSAFAYCTGITEIAIPDSVMAFGVRGFEMFCGCENLKSITIGKGIKNIDPGAFEDCNNLSDITVSPENNNFSSKDGVLFNKDKTELIKYPVGNQRTVYSIPNTVKTIGYSAFHESVNLTDITVPNSVTSIGDRAFAGCTGLTSVTLGNGVTSIEDGAFYGCTGLTSITIPNSVTSIGESAFVDCTGLTSITIPDSVTSIGESAFVDCTGLTNVTLGNSVTSIEDEAFYDCSGLTSITIPGSVTSIGDGAFDGCTSLTSINVASGNNYYSGINGVLFNKKKTELIRYPEGKSQTSYTIPNSVTSIGYAAFAGCTGLASITIPDSVTSIGGYAFYDCSGLKDVYYTGSEAQWKAISVDDYGNDSLINATIHYNWTGEHVCTNKKLVTVPAQCEVNGMSYYICTECGKQIGEATIIPATGHSWGEWHVTKDATATTEGSRERECAACGKKETEIIPILAQTAKDDKSGIEVSAPSGSYNGELELEVEEIFDGESFQIVGTIEGQEQSKIYDVTTKVDGKETQPGATVTVKIPLPEGYDPARTYVYHVNSETGKVENMNARYEDGFLVFETDHFSTYAVVQIKAQKKDSFFKKILNIILAPFRAIINLFKKLFGK